MLHFEFRIEQIHEAAFQQLCGSHDGFIQTRADQIWAAPQPQVVALLPNQTGPVRRLLQHFGESCVRLKAECESNGFSRTQITAPLPTVSIAAGWLRKES